MDVKNRSKILDSDSHCIEHPTVWTDRLPESWGEERMHMCYDADQDREFWCIGDERVNMGWHNAFYGAKGDTVLERRYPRRWSDVSPICWDPKARLGLMDEWGVEAAVLFPNGAGFSLTPFLKHPDPVVSAAHCSAYNDFLMEEWVGASPGRFIPMATVPYWDVPRAVAEIERIAGTGYGGFVMTGAPQVHGQPFLRDRHWDRMWAAAQAAELAIAFHVANGDPTAGMEAERVAQEPHDIMETRLGFLIAIDNCIQTSDILLSGVLGRFPRLKFVISESGVGWVPFLLEACDQRFKRQQIRLPEFDGLLPSELFRRQVYVNCFYEEIQPLHLDWAGEDNLMFQTDVPHPTGFYMFPDADIVKDSIEPVMAALDDRRANKILWDNAAALYAPSLALRTPARPSVDAGT
jgi:predicted TIM-barrel fold metal-dependent hydrolase